MEVLNLTGATSYSNKDIKVDTQKLLVLFTGANYLSSNATIEIKIQGEGRSKEVCPAGTPILDLMEFAAAKEGFIERVNLGGSKSTSGCIDLTYDGAIPCGNKQFIQIAIAGVAAADTIQIFSVSDNVVAENYIHYDRQRIGSGIVKQNVQTIGYDYLMLATSGFDKFQPNYYTGRNEELSNAEMRILGNDANDLVMVTLDNAAPTQQYGFLNNYIHGLVTADGQPNVVSAMVFTQGNGYTYYLINSEAL